MLDFISNIYRKVTPPPIPEAGVTQFIDNLPADNPAMALEELTHWLIDLSNEAQIDLNERVKRLARIDKSAQQYERALRRQYTEASRMHKAVEARIWDASVDFLEATVSAHVRCAAKLSHKGEQYNQYLAIVIMRAMRRLDLHAHWLHLRYQPLPTSLWEQFFFLIKLAEDRALLQTPITLNSVNKTQTNIAQEMLKPLMMSVTAPEHLTKTQIDLAHRMTQSLADGFCWEQIPRGGVIFHLDFAKPGMPEQIGRKPDPHVDSRCFGSVEAVRALVVGLMQLERGEAPATLGTIDFAHCKHEDLLAVMTHLSQRWCPVESRNALQTADMRHAERTQAYYRINVAHGFTFLCEQLMPTQIESPPVTRAHEDESESWVVENISQMGYGVTLSSQQEDWVTSNTIVGMQPDDAPWQIGLIRRVTSDTAESTQAGIQILSNQPQAATLRAVDEGVHAAHAVGILLHREPPYQNQESLLLASGSFQLHLTYAMVVGEQVRSIRVLDRINTFEGVDQVIFADVKLKA